MACTTPAKEPKSSMIGSFSAMDTESSPIVVDKQLMQINTPPERAQKLSVCSSEIAPVSQNRFEILADDNAMDTSKISEPPCAVRADFDMDDDGPTPAVSPPILVVPSGSSYSQPEVMDHTPATSAGNVSS